LRAQSLEPDSPSEAIYPKQKYQYRRLNYELGKEIRVMILRPGEFEDPLCVDIAHVNLLDDPIYEALSYTWATEDGDASLSSEIYCADRQIAITQNCAAALRRLRRPEQERTVWVDAVCIDQETTAERNHQVELMGTIYSKATRVLVYPGEVPGSVFSALEALEADLVLSPTLRSELRQFLSRRWFHRVWVIQELALATRAQMVLSSKIVFFTPELVRRIRKVCLREKFEVPGPLALEPGFRNADFLTLLHTTRNCEATDPKDKIFAILGLVDRRTRSQVPVDYSRSIVDIYTNVATAVIAERKSLDIIQYGCGNGSVSQLMGLPSWVPDWSKLSVRPMTLSSLFGLDFGTFDIARDPRKTQEISIEYKKDGLEKVIQCGGRASEHTTDVCQGPVTSVRVQAEFLRGFIERHVYRSDWYHPQTSRERSSQQHHLYPWHWDGFFHRKPDTTRYVDSLISSGASLVDLLETELAEGVLFDMRDHPTSPELRKNDDMRGHPPGLDLRKIEMKLSTWPLRERFEEAERTLCRYWERNAKNELDLSADDRNALSSLYATYNSLSSASLWYVKGINRALLLVEIEPGKYRVVSDGWMHKDDYLLRDRGWPGLKEVMIEII
jgi:hypothetical protein